MNSHSKQNSIPRSQISEGALKRQSYLDNSYRKSAEIRELRGMVGDSFNSLAKDPAVDSTVLQHEVIVLNSRKFVLNFLDNIRMKYILT